MSHVEAGIYQGPRPGCIYCKGTGIRKVRRAHEEGWDVVSERCACTDPRPQSRAQAGRTPKGSEGKQGAERLRRKKTREREKRMSETRKDNRTKEWAERVGREAVGLGFVEWEIANCYKAGKSILTQSGVLPDFRDRLTELAFIAWVEDVAREVYGKGAHVKFTLPDEAFWAAHVYIGTPGSFGSRARHEIDRDTLAEACIAAVRAMKGGE